MLFRSCFFVLLGRRKGQRIKSAQGIGICLFVKQLSIFLENKSGRLTEVTEVLAKENINLSALCIAENADFGILRGIVSDPDRAYKALKDNHFAVNVTDVVGISCPNVPGALAKVLGYLSAEGVFIEYMYSFANNNIANVVIRPSNLDKCIEVLKEKKDRKSTRLNSSHANESRMPSSA